MYSGEYDACDVTLSVYPHRASLKNMPDHGGNRTYDLWNTSPMLCQLSYAVWSVRAQAAQSYPVLLIYYVISLYNSILKITYMCFLKDFNENRPRLALT